MKEHTLQMARNSLSSHMYEFCEIFMNFVTLGRLRTSLIVHMKSHSGHRDHMCEFCGEVFVIRQKVSSIVSSEFVLRQDVLLLFA
jgi:hypothetical protein